MQLERSDFEKLKGFVHRTLGIHLTDEKRSMVEQRLRSLVLGRGLGSYGALLESVERGDSADLMTEFVNRITTNHTFFNREPEHFRFLEESVLPEHIAASKKGKSLRMWCAAASRGHEPYTLAMIQRQVLGKEYGSWDAGLLATDISERSLSFAIRARYPEDEVQALPATLRATYLRRLSDGSYEVSPEVRKEVLFRKFNLHSPHYAFKRPFDVVFCRNVLIYFDGPTKLEVARKITDNLRDGGYLFVGLAESLGREAGALRYLRPGIYRKGG